MLGHPTLNLFKVFVEPVLTLSRLHVGTAVWDWKKHNCHDNVKTVFQELLLFKCYMTKFRQFKFI